jgi:hypothetical protein
VFPDDLVVQPFNVEEFLADDEELDAEYKVVEDEGEWLCHWCEEDDEDEDYYDLTRQVYSCSACFFSRVGVNIDIPDN